MNHMTCRGSQCTQLLFFSLISLQNFDGGLSSSRAGSETGSEGTADELGDSERRANVDSDSDTEDVQIHLDYFFGGSNRNSRKKSSMSDADDFDKLSKTLMQRAESMGNDNVSVGSSHNDEFSMGSDTQASTDFDDDRDRRQSMTRRRSSRARFVNKALVRLYDRRAFTGGLVFSRGHFLGDVSKMMAGVLSAAGDGSDAVDAEEEDEAVPSYGFGEKEPKKRESKNISNMVIQENEEGNMTHTSTLTAEKQGCIVLVFPRKSLTEFLDAHPGLLLSLLGTQVIV